MEIIGTYKGFKVREVDGKTVRDNLGTAFTEWGSHLTYKFTRTMKFGSNIKSILMLMIRKPLIAAAYTEYEAIKNGKSKDSAYKAALDIQEKIRKTQKHLDYPIKIKKLATLGKLKLWLVNGEVIRDELHPEFAEGGHGLVYDYIPKNEIWLDAAESNDLTNLFVHEITEYNLMAKGMKYEPAHAIDNETEHKARKNKEDQTKILKEQLRKLLNLKK